MMDGTDNHTLRVLQDMRARLHDADQQFASIGQQIDASTLILKVMAGMLHEHEQRISAIEPR